MSIAIDTQLTGPSAAHVVLRALLDALGPRGLDPDQLYFLGKHIGRELVAGGPLSPEEVSGLLGFGSVALHPGGGVVVHGCSRCPGVGWCQVETGVLSSWLESVRGGPRNLRFAGRDEASGRCRFEPADIAGESAKPAVRTCLTAALSAQGLKVVAEAAAVSGGAGLRPGTDLAALARWVRGLHQQEAPRLRETAPEQGAGFELEDLVGTSKLLQSVRAAARKLAGSPINAILITGETGTGKEITAHGIHRASGRAGGPFVAVNCAAIPEQLLESELFGYEAGAFTDARRGGKPGRFELAHGGTLFLDEVGDLAPTMQAKLLRVLQDGRVDRIGALRSRVVDVRVIAATHHDLARRVRDGLFRADLLYRLAAAHLHLPPLRERPEDIPAIATAVLDGLNRRYPLLAKRLTDGALRALSAHAWPGNARELRNVLESAFFLVDGEEIDAEHLVGKLQAAPADSPARGASPLHPGRTTDVAGVIPLSELERRAIAAALEATGGNKRETARLLGIGRTSLYQKLRRYGLT